MARGSALSVTGRAATGFAATGFGGCGGKAVGCDVRSVRITSSIMPSAAGEARKLVQLPQLLISARVPAGHPNKDVILFLSPAFAARRQALVAKACSTRKVRMARGLAWPLWPLGVAWPFATG